MKAVIMAGGRGTRLRPLTCHLPKPMVPLIGKPCMAYIVDLLKKYGIHDIAVTMQYKPDVIRDYFGDGHAYGVNIQYFEETTPLGTAGSVKNAQAFLDETFIVISGDALTDFNLEQPLAFHKQRQAKATLVLTRVNQPLEYGVVMTDDEGQIIRFLEKPSWGEVFSDTVNTGIYILEPETIERVPHGKEFDFSQHLFPTLLQEQSGLYGYISSGYWSDIGNLEQYRQTQFDMLDGRVQLNMPGKQIRPGIYLAEGVATNESTRLIGPAYIGEGCTLEEDVEIGEYCIIGKNNRLSKGSVLTRSVLWDNNHIAEHNELSGSTLTSRIISHKASFLGEGSVIGNHVVIGAGSHIQPNVKIWPHKQIRQNTRLHTSFIWGDNASKSLFKTHGISGVPNLDITPEFVAKFATAYGAGLAIGQTLTVSCSPHPFTRLLKRTIAASLQSVGANVIDLGDAIAPAASFAICRLGTAGGIHIDWSGCKSELCSIACIDAEGLPITRSAERKVENSYWQEDYRRASTEQIGSYKQEEYWIGTYLDALASEISNEQDRKKAPPLRAVIEASPWLQTFLVPFFEKLGVEAIHVTTSSLQESLHAFVPLSEAHLGLRLNDDGRGMQLLTEHGITVDDDLQTVFLYLCYLHNRPGATIGAPVSAPHLLESMAESLGATIIRTKEWSRAILEATEQARMHPLFDSLFAVGLVLLYLGRTGVPFSELLSLFPSFHLHRARIDCPWANKGQVMRSLMERTKDTRVDVVDGIKFYHEDGWVLLLPDADDPVFRLVAQSTSPLIAQSLVETYREHILNELQ
ncbi:NTP transferase domain-containing protein [Paenibacillus sp. SYP-B3998]|uniref:NTP transferase domain-containing protein n=1 Tax=Paenibacillus sp. SYP-B3998 TaxID=2678564 RepID=A0A6G3ZZW9_9BACL|nr:sugar phosphate nucleotidyltransferase [Paenibacillus sp. SYP-B3998]NEW07234.1 NTP transferase domain-containing protein [Paenibacillus sp. SYP-B3998]